MTTYTTITDLTAAVRDLRPDAAAVGVTITPAWVRAQLDEMGLGLREATSETASAIADGVDALADEAVSDDQIESLRREAGTAGDAAQVALCDRALDGDDTARAECVRVIRAAAAMVD